MQERDYELLSAYLDGECTPDEQREVTSLLESSPEARRELEVLGRIQSLTQSASASIPTALPRDFAAAFQTSLQADADAPNPSNGRRAKRGRIHAMGARRWYPFAAAAVLVVGVFGAQYVFDGIIHDYTPHAEPLAKQEVADQSQGKSGDQESAKYGELAENSASATMTAEDLADHNTIEKKPGHDPRAESEKPAGSDSVFGDPKRKRAVDSAADATAPDREHRDDKLEKKEAAAEGSKGDAQWGEEGAPERVRRGNALKPAEDKAKDRAKGEANDALRVRSLNELRNEIAAAKLTQFGVCISSPTLDAEQAFDAVYNVLGHVDTAATPRDRAQESRARSSGAATLPVQEVRDHGDFVDYEIDIPRDQLSRVVESLARLQSGNTLTVALLNEDCGVTTTASTDPALEDEDAAEHGGAQANEVDQIGELLRRYRPAQPAPNAREVESEEELDQADDQRDESPRQPQEETEEQAKERAMRPDPSESGEAPTDESDDDEAETLDGKADQPAIGSAQGSGADDSAQPQSAPAPRPAGAAPPSSSSREASPDAVRIVLRIKKK